MLLYYLSLFFILISNHTFAMHDIGLFYENSNYKYIIENKDKFYRSEDYNKVQCFVGLSLKKLGHIEEAKKILGSVKGPFQELALIELVNISLELNDVNAANHYYNMISHRSEIKDDIYFRIADYYFFNRNYDIAKLMFNQILKSKLGDRATLKLGIIAYVDRDYESAVNLFNKVENVESYYYLGNSYIAKKDLKKAFKYYKKVIDAGDSEFYMNSLLELIRYFGDAWSRLAISYVLESKKTDLVVLLSDFLIESGKYDQALNLLASATFVSRDYVIEKNSEIFILMGDYKAAVNELEKMSDKGEKYFFLKSLAYTYKHNFKLALEFADKCSTDYKYQCYLSIARENLTIDQYESLHLFEQIQKAGVYLKEALAGVLEALALIDQYDEKLIREYSKYPFEKDDQVLYKILLTNLIKQNNYKVALAVVDDIFKKDKEKVLVDFVLATLIDWEEYNLARHYCKHLEDNIANLYRGIISLNTNMYEDAKFLLSRVYGELYEDALYFLIETNIAKHDYKDADENINKYFEFGYTKFNEILLEKKCDVMFYQEKYSDLINLFYNNKNSESILMKVADSYYNLKKIEDSYKLYLELSKSSDNNVKRHALIGMGQILYYNKKYVEAEKIFLEINSHEESFYFLAEIYIKLENFEKAIIYFRKFFQYRESNYRLDNWIERIIGQIEKYPKEARSGLVSLARELNKEKTLIELAKSNFISDGVTESLSELVKGSYKNEAIACLADYYFIKKNYVKAYEYYDKLSSIREPRFRKIGFFGKASVDILVGKYNNVILKLNEIRSNNLFFDDKIYYFLSLAYNGIGDYKSYINVLKRSVFQVKESTYIEYALEGLLKHYLSIKNMRQAENIYVRLKGVNNEVSKNYFNVFNF